MNLLNQEIQVIQFTIEFYKKRIKKLEQKIEEQEQSGRIIVDGRFYDGIRYYNNRIELLEGQLKIRLKEAKE